MQQERQQAAGATEGGHRQAGSDVRLLQLSQQPTSLTRDAGTTTCAWKYRRLLFGQSVRLDVLGIAPIDRRRDQW